MGIARRCAVSSSIRFGLKQLYYSFLQEALNNAPIRQIAEIAGLASSLFPFNKVSIRWGMDSSWQRAKLYLPRIYVASALDVSLGRIYLPALKALNKTLAA